jgi:hypothetical protein
MAAVGKVRRGGRVPLLLQEPNGRNGSGAKAASAWSRIRGTRAVRHGRRFTCVKAMGMQEEFEDIIDERARGRHAVVRVERFNRVGRSLGRIDRHDRIRKPGIGVQCRT